PAAPDGDAAPATPNFAADPDVVERLSRDAKALKQAGAAGFVFGFLDGAGSRGSDRHRGAHPRRSRPCRGRSTVPSTTPPTCRPPGGPCGLLPNLATVLTSRRAHRRGGRAARAEGARRRGRRLHRAGRRRPAARARARPARLRHPRLPRRLRRGGRARSDPVEWRLVRQWRALVERD
ncbi:hypothetical protein, partial [Nonomuraea rubra]|uniref:hypothetical protein n=1 Tax=Nonomuraea rubra TaxID=46180 RepID=UPI0031E89E51